MHTVTVTKTKVFYLNLYCVVAFEKCKKMHFIVDTRHIDLL